MTHAASLLRNILSENGDDDDGGIGGGNGMSASLICAGYDHELEDGAIYAIGTNGIIFEEENWAIMGSGSSYLLGYLDSQLGESSASRRSTALVVVDAEDDI